MPVVHPMCITCHWLDIDAGNVCRWGPPRDAAPGVPAATWKIVDDPETTRGCSRHQTVLGEEPPP